MFSDRNHQNFYYPLSTIEDSENRAKRQGQTTGPNDRNRPIQSSMQTQQPIEPTETAPIHSPLTATHSVRHPPNPIHLLLVPERGEGREKTHKLIYTILSNSIPRAQPVSRANTIPSRHWPIVRATSSRWKRSTTVSMLRRRGRPPNSVVAVVAVVVVIGVIGVIGVTGTE